LDSPPVPDGTQLGTGVDGAAGSGSGLFFFGVAALLASVGLALPRGLLTLPTTRRAAAPKLFVLLLERPG
jgi:hypothetical protein